jgi:oligoribonuclease (3'-5' exoribonuclease)
MNEWCINQHGKTGLTQACIDSPHTHEEVEEKVRAYLEKWIPEAGAGLLAGSSVHADMRYVPSFSFFPAFFHPKLCPQLFPLLDLPVVMAE